MDINLEVLKKLLLIVEKKIKDINKAISTSQEEIEKVNEFDVLISLINENELCFADPKFNEDLEMLVGEVIVEDKEFLNTFLDTIEYLKFVATSVQDSKFSSFSQDELEQVKDVVESLTKIKALSNEQKAEERKRFTKSNTELVQCVALYDKLRQGKEGLLHLNSDLPYLMTLLKEQDNQFVKDVLELVRVLTMYIHNNIMEQIKIDSLTTEVDEEELEDTLQEEIDEELIKELFSKYGFDFNIFTKNHRKILTTKCKLQRIENVLEVLSSYPEYSFVKLYQNRSGEKSLFLIFRYATKETLEYLVNDAKNRNVRLEDIFRVNGVYKKVSKKKESLEQGPPKPEGKNDEYLNGSYEYYKANSKLFENLTVYYRNNYGIEIDFYHEILLKAPDVFTLPSELVAKNIQYMKDYNINLTTHTNGVLEPNAPSVLSAGSFLRLSDILIENGLYNYIVEYPSVVKDEPLVKIILFEQRNNNLKLNSRGQIRYIRHNRNSYNMNEVENLINRNNINYLLKDLILPDKFYEMLDAIESYVEPVIKDDTIRELDENPQIKVSDIIYNILGVKVSRLKFIRVWSALVKCGLTNEYAHSKLLLFALTYNSIYSDEALQKIVEFVNQPEFGGVPSNGTSKSI